MAFKEPELKRATVFVDGQNLFYSAKMAFGYPYPNYDILALAKKVCEAQNWKLTEARFYTGIPDVQDDAFWNHFWIAKLGQMGRQGVKIFSRPLRYRNNTIRLQNGTLHTALVAQEKGIDVRIALDIVSRAFHKAFDVAVVFSQDQDLSEVVDEIREIQKEQARWIKIACAFPMSPTSQNRRGINGTDWIKIGRQVYDACLDPRDYRPKRT